MATPYTLQKKKNPQDKSAAPKWYAVPISSSPMDEDTMTKAATQDTTFSDVELAAAAKLLARFVLSQLLQGKRARIGGFGTFRVTFRSKGVENINDFDAASMISDVRISFLTDAKLRAEFLSSVRFENAGVKEDDIYYGDLASYRKAKGLDTGTPGGGDGEDQGGSGSMG